MSLHKQYKDLFDRNYPDFIVSYRLVDPDCLSGSRNVHQGIRWNLIYEEDIVQKQQVYMVFPEFIEQNGTVILDSAKPLDLDGYAGMWVLTNDMISFHLGRLRVGDKCYFVEGSKIMAECEVIQIGNLSNDSGDHSVQK